MTKQSYKCDMTQSLALITTIVENRPHVSSCYTHNFVFVTFLKAMKEEFLSQLMRFKCIQMKTNVFLTLAGTAAFAAGFAVFFSSSEESLLSSDDSCFFCGAALATGLAATGAFLAGSSSESLSLSLSELSFFALTAT